MGKTKLRKNVLGNEVPTQVVAQEQPQTRYEKAIWWKSLLAYGIDLAIYWILAFIFITSMQVYAVEGNQNYSIFMLVSLVLSAIYLYVVLPKYVKGQTVGRLIMKIRLDATGKKQMTYWRYFLREFMAKINMVALLVPMSAIYGGIQWISKKQRPTQLMIDELFQTQTVDLRKPLTDE
ncbi:MAG: RDD family protein [Culicoidibacterales bacterium]